MHASAYRRPEETRGKRVLVVGGGESGGDIAAEVSGSAAETVLSLRRGVAVLPRWIPGRPNDCLTSRINNSSAHGFSRPETPRIAGKADFSLDLSPPSDLRQVRGGPFYRPATSGSRCSTRDACSGAEPGWPSFGPASG